MCLEELKDFAAGCVTKNPIPDNDKGWFYGYLREITKRQRTIQAVSRMGADDIDGLAEFLTEFLTTGK
jgi:hypothetical protein